MYVLLKYYEKHYCDLFHQSKDTIKIYFKICELHLYGFYNFDIALCINIQWY